jgi:hypothetical protein
MIRLKFYAALPILTAFWGFQTELLAQGFSGSSTHYSADSLPAFKSDTSDLDPFRKAESAGSPFAAKPGTLGADSGAGRIDSVTRMLRLRTPGISLYLGVDFFDFSAKEKFVINLQNRAKRDSLDIPQNFEPVHLAFPIGLQAVFPISDYLDLVAKTHSYWYKQTAILGTRATKIHAGDEWYAVQGNLAGFGMRYSLPPALLSVTGQLGLYIQGIWYWNLGNTQIYSPYGNARADFNPSGSGYEILLGYQKAVSKPWVLSGAIGFIHQEFQSKNTWRSLLIHSPPSGKVSWGSSAIQANLNLWYYFGIKAPPINVPAAPTLAPAAIKPVPVESKPILEVVKPPLTDTSRHP